MGRGRLGGGAEVDGAGEVERAGEAGVWRGEAGWEEGRRGEGGPEPGRGDESREPSYPSLPRTREMALTVGGADEAGLLELDVAPEVEDPLLDGRFDCWSATRFLAGPAMMTVLGGSDGGSVDSSSVNWSCKSEATQVGEGCGCDALVML